MISDPSDKTPPHPFEVFRSDGATRLPGQRFPNSEGVDPSRRSGPVQQRAIHDASGAPAPRDVERGTTALGRDEKATPGDVHHPATESADPEPIRIRIDTYTVDLAARIARVQAEQKGALDKLQQLEDDSRDPDTASA